MKRTLFAVAATTAAAAVVLTGCQAPSTAAYVGDRTVSTTRLDDAITVSLANGDVRKTWGSKQPALRRQILDTAVYHELIGQVARRDHASVKNGEVDAIVAALQSSVQQQGTQLDAALAQTFGVAPTQARSLLTDIALTGEVALDEGLLKLPKQYRIGAIEVKNAAEGATVAQALARNESSYASLAKRYAGQNTLPKPTTISEQSFTQAVGPQHANAQPHTTFALPLQGGTDLVVVHVFEATAPTPDDLSPTDRALAVVNAYQSGRGAVVAKFAGRVRINPRFGRWDAQTGRVADTKAPAVLTNDKS